MDKIEQVIKRWKAFFYINPSGKTLQQTCFENVELSPENKKNGFIRARVMGFSLQNKIWKS